MLTPLKAWLWLTRALEIGPAWQVVEHFGTAEKAYFSDPEEYALIPRLTPRHRQRLADKSLAEADEILAQCDAGHIKLLTWQDADYPERLRNIDLPPLVLYYRGTLPRFDDEIAIAIAGTRKATPYGRKVAAEMAFQITRLGGLVLTGIVEGCDGYAADGALKAGGGPVCVLAGGVDVPYYANESNRRLLADAAARGAVISEYPPQTAHLSEHFASRNRLLTGLALGTLCVEAPAKSGTLGVARLALEQGRDVYAVPANIDAVASAGTNQLLARGEAICVCSGADVLEHYWALYPHRRKTAPPLTDRQRAQRLEPMPAPVPEAPPAAAQPLAGKLRQVRLSEHASEFTDDEQAILHALEGGAQITDALVAATGLPARRVSAALMVLTIRALVLEKPGGQFEAAVQLI